MHDVGVVGSANEDLVALVGALPAPGETVLGHDLLVAAGGKGLNQAVAAARLGASTAFVGMVGSDAAGAALRATLRGEGIDVASLETVDVPTGRAFISVADDGENSIVVVPGANHALDATAVERHRHTLGRSRVVLAQLEIPLDAVAQALVIGREGRALTVLNIAPSRDLPDELLGLVDLLVANQHEAASLAGRAVSSVDDAIGAAEVIAHQGPSAVVITLGSRGAVVHDGARHHHVPPFAVTALDTTAAGDAFCGALAARLSLGVPLPDAVRWANAAGALAATSYGAVPSLPRLLAVETLVGGP